MRASFRVFVLLVLLASAALAQNPISAPPVSTSILSLPVYTLNAAPVAGASLTLIGSSGQTQICYWAVANYQIGSVMSPLGCLSTAAATLSGSNYVAINPWSYPSSVVSVDILKTSSSVAPVGTCNCAVATGLTSGGTNDQSNSTSGYTVTLFNPGSLGITLTNEVTGNGVSHLMYRQNGALVKDLSTSGGGTVGGTGTANSFAGWTASSTLGNAPCTFTATTMTCSAPQTSPSGNSILSLVGGAGAGVANPWALVAAGGVGGLGTGIPAIAASYINGGVGNHIGINAAIDVGEFSVWGGTNLLFNLTSSFATIAKSLQLSAGGLASTAALRFGTGGQALFTGGSGTTTWPVLYMNDCGGCGGGSGPTTWSTSGTYFGVNAITGFAGNFADYRLNGGSALFQVTSTGLTNAAGGFQQNGTPLGNNCGTTTTCANTAAPLVRIVYGSAPLVSGTPSVAVVTGISPAFTSTTSYSCSADEATTAANAVKVVNTSTSSITITGPNTVSDVVSYVCAGT